MAAANLTAGKPWIPKWEVRERDMLEVAAGIVLYPGCRVGWNTTAGSTKGYLVKYDQTSANSGIVLVGTYEPTINIGATIDNSAGANGAAKAEVRYHRTMYFLWWDNDTVHTCAASDRGSLAYGESDHEAGNTAGSLSSVGRVWAIGSGADGTNNMVLVESTGIF